MPADVQIFQEWLALHAEDGEFNEAKKEFIPSSKTIYVETKIKEDDLENLSYYGNLMHEFTHALQNSGNNSDCKFINDCFKRKTTDDETFLKTVTKLSEIVTTFEGKIKKHIIAQKNKKHI